MTAMDRLVRCARLEGIAYRRRCEAKDAPQAQWLVRFHRWLMLYAERLRLRREVEGLLRAALQGGRGAW